MPDASTPLQTREELDRRLAEIVARVLVAAVRKDMQAGQRDAA